MTDPAIADEVTWRTDAPGVVVVTMAAGPANALGPGLLGGLHAAIDAAEHAGDTKVVILDSALDGFFAAGADIKHLSAIDAESFTAYGAMMRALNDRLEDAKFLSIAAVDGLALGGGLELALACTLRVGSRRAKYGLPEVKIGLIPGAGGTQRLPRLVGAGRATDIIVTGRQVEAEEAQAIGLTDRLADDPSAAARTLADGLVTASLPAQLAGARCVAAAFDRSTENGMAFEVAQEQDLFEHGEAVEGIAAFVGKRAPRFG